MQCNIREVGCHSTCEDYIGWRRETLKEYQAIQACKKQEAQITQHHKQAMRKAYKRRGVK